LEDTAEFFNLILGVKLSKQGKGVLVAFMGQLQIKGRVGKLVE